MKKMYNNPQTTTSEVVLSQNLLNASPTPEKIDTKEYIGGDIKLL